MEKSLVGSIAKLLTLIGALNWGLIGIGNLTGNDLNVVSMLLGGVPVVEAIVYILVGLSAVSILLPSNGR